MSCKNKEQEVKLKMEWTN